MLQDDFPLVSVVIPNRNRTGPLYRCIESVRKQTYPNWEIIIVDDSDSEIYAKIYSKYRNVTHVSIFKGERKGDAEARLKGFKLANGKYVAFLDSDDYWEPEKLSACVEFFKKNENVKVLWDNSFVEKPGGPRMEILLNFTGGKNNIIPQRQILKLLMGENFIHMSSGVVEREAVESIGGPLAIRPFDYINWLILATKFDFGHVDRYLTTKVDSEDGLGSNRRILFIENWNTCRLRLQILLRDRSSFSLWEKSLLLLRIVLLSPGLHIFLPQSIRKIFRLILYTARSYNL
ncbi:MAG: glycosyltransferase family 2 protein [Nitrososphaerota archaeon]